MSDFIPTFKPYCNGKAYGGFTTNCPKNTTDNYIETSVDTEKKNADILLTSIDGNWYSLFLNVPIEIPNGRGVKKHNDKAFSVTKKIFDDLQSRYVIKTDF